MSSCSASAIRTSTRPRRFSSGPSRALRAGDTHYTPAAGRSTCARRSRPRIARAPARRSMPDNVIFLAGAQNALFAASLCVAGPGDEVIALEPLYPSYPATLEVSGARMVRVRGAGGATASGSICAALEAAITPRTRAMFFATPNNPSGVILSEADLAVDRRARAPPFALDRGGRGVCGPRARRQGAEPRAESARASGDHQQPVEVAFHAGLARRLAGRADAARSRMPKRWRSACCSACRVSFRKPPLTALGVAAAAESRMRDYCAVRRDLLLAGLAGHRRHPLPAFPTPACSCCSMCATPAFRATIS